MKVNKLQSSAKTNNSERKRTSKLTLTISILFALIAVFIICYISFPSFRIFLMEWEGDELIPDVKEAHIIHMRPSKNQPTTIYIHVNGTIEGKAALQLPFPDGTVFLSGNVDRYIVHDWFLDSFDANYVPEQVSTGQLRIRWNFQHW